MKKILWTTAIALFAVLAIIVLAIAIHDRTEERLPESETPHINVDSLRQTQQRLQDSVYIECDSVYRLNEGNLETLEDSIHFYEDGY